MKKRGLSNLVATVLIVLLALAAVALVWGFLKPAFEKTGSQIDLRTQCMNVEVQPIKCEYVTGASIATVTVKVTQGQPSEVYAAVEFDDRTSNGTRVTAPAVLATKDVDVAFTAIASSAVTARAAGVVTDEQGNYEICTESSVVVDCTAA